MKNKTAYLIFCIILVSFTAWGQKPRKNVSPDTAPTNSETKVNLQREIQLDANSKSEEVMLNIDEDVDRFELAIHTSVTAGNLRIEVYDPNGDHQGTFSFGTQLNVENKERVQGSINKSLRDPRSGNWKVKIHPAEATGRVTIQSAFIY